MVLRIKSPAFKDGEEMPKKYTGCGDNISPPLEWLDVPPGTRTFAVVAECPDKGKSMKTHWMVYNIPHYLFELDENIPKKVKTYAAIKQGVNDYKKVGWDGPTVLPEHKQCVFKVYALDTEIDTNVVSRDDMMSVVKAHALDEGELKVSMSGKSESVDS